MFDNITAVCISKQKESLMAPVPFYCHTEGYRPILHRDNADHERVVYITERYSSAVNRALELYPQTEHIMIIDSYYLHQSDVENLIRAYSMLQNTILGASIWCREKSHIRSTIRYYETLSVKEFEGKRWFSVRALPRGLMKVSAVGACWIFPRGIWKGKFNILPDCLVNSPCLDARGCDVLLDCDVRLWRTHRDNPGIPEYSFLKRVRVSVGEWRRRIL